jgi:hypothetical protein
VAFLGSRERREPIGRIGCNPTIGGTSFCCSERDAGGRFPIIEIATNLARGQTFRSEGEAVQVQRASRQQGRLHASGMREIGLQDSAQLEILQAESSGAQEHGDPRRKLGLLDWHRDHFVDDLADPQPRIARFVTRRCDQDGEIKCVPKNPPIWLLLRAE